MKFTEYQCHFYERVADGHYWRYDMLSVHRSPDQGSLTYTVPPMVGDLIRLQTTVYLDDDAPEDAPDPDPRLGTYRVIGRCFGGPEYGSQAWPYGKEPGPVWLDVICEAADGPFRNEAPSDRAGETA